MKVQLPIINHGSGRAGGMIFQTYWGRTYLRSMPVLFHYPDTPAQQKIKGLYLNLMNQVRAAYDTLRKSFPRNFNTNRNMFNILAKGIFRAADPYNSNHDATPPLRFGYDTQQQIKLIFSDHKINVGKTDIVISMIASIQLWRRSFRPKQAVYIVINTTQQQIQFTSLPWTDGVFEWSFKNTFPWHAEDRILIYVAATNSEMMSSFYLIR